MKIGMIIYSQTGNTLLVASHIKKKLEAKGHEVKIDRIEIEGEAEHNKPITFKTVPKTDQYDALVFGAPVHAFSLCVPMQQYLNDHASIKDKRSVCLMTMAFPFAWMGGNRAIGQMKTLCKKKGSKVVGTGIVNWMGEGRRKKIMSRVVKQLANAF